MNTCHPVLLLAIASLAACNPSRDSDQQNPSESVNLADINLNPVAVFGEASRLPVLESAEMHEVTFGRVGSIAVDGMGKAYVFDPALRKIVKMDESGVLGEFHFPEGDGPGEIRQPSAFAVDESGSMYVADAARLKVAQFDNGGRLVTEIPVQYRVSEFVVQEGRLYALSFAFFRQGGEGVVDRYDLSQPNPEAVAMGTMGPLDADAMRLHAGNIDRFATLGGEVRLMRWYPYLVQTFEESGVMDTVIHREPEDFAAPAFDPVSGGVKFNAGLRSVGEWCPAECYTAVRYYRMRDVEGGRQFEYWWDLWAEGETEPVTVMERDVIAEGAKWVVFSGEKVVVGYEEPNAVLIYK